MYNIGIAFYKEKGHIVDYIIRFVTKSKYSHCEILFPDGSMFSSDAWSGGVRFIGKDEYNLSNWDIIYISLSEAQLAELIKFCYFKESKEYDWKGVIAFIIPFIRQDYNKWFCSELVGAALKFIGIFKSTFKIHKLSPGKLFTAIEEIKNAN